MSEEEGKWKLSNRQRLLNRYNWLVKQSTQRLQSLEQKHAYYDADATRRFIKESEEFIKEAKEIKKQINKIDKEAK